MSKQLSDPTNPQSTDIVPPVTTSPQTPAPTPASSETAKVKLQVPQEKGIVQIFDGAVTKAYEVVDGVIEVAVEDVEQVLRHVTGASIKGPVTGS